MGFGAIFNIKDKLWSRAFLNFQNQGCPLTFKDQPHTFHSPTPPLPLSKIKATVFIVRRELFLNFLSRLFLQQDLDALFDHPFSLPTKPFSWAYVLKFPSLFNQNQERKITPTPTLTKNQPLTKNQKQNKNTPTYTLIYSL